MEFTILKPKRHFTTDTVQLDRIRIGFLKTKPGKHTLRIEFGKYAAKKYGFKAGDRIVFGPGDIDPFTWIILKAQPTETECWKLSNMSNASDQKIKTDLTWQKEWPSIIPKSLGIGMKYVTDTLDNGVLTIKIPSKINALDNTWEENEVK